MSWDPVAESLPARLASPALPVFADGGRPRGNHARPARRAWSFTVEPSPHGMLSALEACQGPLLLAQSSSLLPTRLRSLKPRASQLTHEGGALEPIVSGEGWATLSDRPIHVGEPVTCVPEQAQPLVVR